MNAVLAKEVDGTPAATRRFLGAGRVRCTGRRMHNKQSIYEYYLHTTACMGPFGLCGVGGRQACRAHEQLLPPLLLVVPCQSGGGSLSLILKGGQRVFAPETDSIGVVGWVGDCFGSVLGAY